MGSKFWTFGISCVLLAVYLYASTYTYLTVYVLLTSVSAYPPTELPTTHPPIYIPTYPPPSLPHLIPTYLPI